MARNPRKSTPTTPQTPTINEPFEAKAPVAAKPEGVKVEYFRIQRISGHLAQLLSVEVDEATNLPKPIGKPDLPVLVQDRALPYLYPSADMIDRKRRDDAKKAGSKI